MNIDYLVLVVDSVEEFFNQNFGLDLRRKEMELHESFSSGIEEGAFLDLVGDVEGRVVLTYSQKFKSFVLDVLLADFSLALRSEELQEEALKELLNQLSGHIITKMEEVGYNWDIGVPHFFKRWGEHRWEGKKLEAVEIPYFRDEVGEMKVRIAMEEKNGWPKEEGK